MPEPRPTRSAVAASALVSPLALPLAFLLYEFAIEIACSLHPEWTSVLEPIFRDTGRLGAIGFVQLALANFWAFVGISIALGCLGLLLLGLVGIPLWLLFRRFGVHSRWPFVATFTALAPLSELLLSEHTVSLRGGLIVAWFVACLSLSFSFLVDRADGLFARAKELAVTLGLRSARG